MQITDSQSFLNMFYVNTILIIIISPSLSTHTPLHQPKHDGGSSSHIHSGRQWCQDCDVPQANACEMTHMYSKTHSRDNPSDRHEIRLSDNSHRKLCYVPPMAIPRWVAQSASIRRERLAHCQCLQHKGYEPDCTSSYNTLARSWCKHIIRIIQRFYVVFSETTQIILMIYY